MPFDVGKTLRLTARLTDVTTGEPVAPVSVVFEVMAPNGTVPFIPTVINDGVVNGAQQYHADFQVTGPGQWSWRLDTTNPNDGAERSFWVNSTRFPGG